MLFGKLGVSLKVCVTKCASLPCGETSQVDYRPEAPRPEMGWGGACGRLLGLSPNSWFHLDFCVINRRLPVSGPQVSSEPLLPYKGNPL